MEPRPWNCSRPEERPEKRHKGRETRGQTPGEGDQRRDTREGRPEERHQGRETRGETREKPGKRPEERDQIINDLVYLVYVILRLQDVNLKAEIQYLKSKYSADRVSYVRLKENM